MASRLATLKNATGNTGWKLEFRRLAHVAALSPPLDSSITSPISYPPLASPEFEQERDRTYENNDIGFGFQSFSIGGSMELMAVPKKKVSRHKRGIRNGPKALKPVPVIIRCKSCGRVKLPHFFCCSGERNAEQQ